MPLGSNNNIDTDEPIESLLSWCDSNGINIDPRIELVRNEDGSLSVYTKDAFVENGVTRTPCTLLHVLQT